MSLRFAIHLETLTQRTAVYTGCAVISFVLVAFFSFHGGLKVRKSILPERGTSVALGQTKPKPMLAASYSKLPLSFELNQGQTDPHVKFLSHGRGYGLFLTRNQAVLELQASGFRIPDPEAGARPLVARAALRRTKGSGAQPASNTGPGAVDLRSGAPGNVLRLALVNASQNAVVTGASALPGRVNYFLGNDPKKWRTNVPTYAQVRYQNVYPGIDLFYYGNQGGQLEYDFVVAPGADPSSISLAVDAGGHAGNRQKAGGGNQTRAGSGQPRLDSNGDLVVRLHGNDEVRFHKPLVYQEAESGVSGQKSRERDQLRDSAILQRQSSIANREFREGHFTLDAQNRVHFALGPYDHTKPLIIDPVLTYSTYLGGSGGDWGDGIAVDPTGNAYVAGETASNDFPTVNPYQASDNSLGQGTAFVAKLNPSGSTLLYSTYLGGNGGETCYSIAVDAAGEAYVTGQTYSTNFPLVNALQTSNLSSPGGGTAFVTKLDAAGSALVYSTYLGGNVADEGKGIAIDISGDAYVTGNTLSTDFPVTRGAFQATGPMDTCNALTNSSPCADAFVTKLNPAGSALVYSTYLGGTSYNAGFGIAVDSSGDAYVTGTTSSSDFPKLDPLQATLNGTTNAFVTKLDATGSALVYSTFLGGSGSDEATSIAVDSTGSAYVAGYTSSDNFPTAAPLQATNNVNNVEFPGNPTGFVCKLTPSGSGFIYSTYLGGNVGDWAYGIAVDSSGDAHVVGQTSSTTFPTVNPIQKTNNVTWNSENPLPTAFVAELNPAGSALIYSTYLGGTVQDSAVAVAVSSSGNVYITGNTSSPDFPTVNPLQATNNNAQQPGPTAFVAEISPGPAAAGSFSPGLLNFGNVLENSTSAQSTVTLTNLGKAPLIISNITASGDYAVVTSATSCFYTVATLAPLAKCTVGVTFTPTELGVRTGGLAISDNASGSPQTLQLTGVGAVSAANISPGNLFFGNQNIGTTSSPQAVTLTNTASVALAVSSVTVSSGWTQTNNCLPSVGPNASCTINVSFQPTLASQYIFGNLFVTDDAVNSPQSVQLTGSGVGGQASLSPTSLNFGSQVVGSSSATQTIMLLNPNNGGIGVPGIWTTGDFQEADVCTSLMGLTLDTPCPIAVTFTPTATGTRTGTLNVSYTQPTALTLTASLTGTGTIAEASLSAATLTFGAQSLGSTSSPQAVTLSNTGNGALTVFSINVTGNFATTNTCNGSVAANSSCTINVTFTPTEGGTRTGTLIIIDNSNGSIGPNVANQTVSLSGKGMDFGITSSTTSQTVSAGQTANYSLTVAPQGGFSQTVNLACTGAPSESTCTVTPSSVTLNGTASATVAVAVSTTAPSLAPPRGKFPPPAFIGFGRLLWLCALLGLATAALAVAKRRRAAYLLSACLLMAILWSACGGGGGGSTSPSNPGTPAGSSTLTVTGTAGSGSSALSHSVTLTLTVS